MEIYKLSDKVEEKGGRRGKRDARDGVCNGGSNEYDNVSVNGGSVITGLKQGVKNPERVNVYVNGKYELSLDTAQVVDLKVKVGRALTTEELEKLRRASEYGKLYQRTLEWALTRPRSEREVRDYLRRKVYEKRSDENYIDTIIERLKLRGYVDDRKFAEFWVENRFVKKGVSRKRLEVELMKKGVMREIVDEVLGGRNDEEELRKMVEKKKAKYGDLEKLMAYLVRQGFSYDLVRKVVKED